MTHYLRKAFVPLSLCLSLFVLGCSCGKDDGNCGKLECFSNELCCDVDGMPNACIIPPDDLVSLGGYPCQDPAELDGQCNVFCPDPPPLDPGSLAEHLDSVQLSDGTLIIAGYSAGVVGAHYGDLVVATVDASAQSANFDLAPSDWTILDGVPAGAPVTNPPGWRDGVSEPGDDVGRFASLAVNAAEDTVFLSYYDKTNGALKLATLDVAANTWSIQVVDATDNAGLYSAVTILPSGQPAIAYGAIVPAAMGDKEPSSETRVITASDTSMGLWNAATVVVSRTMGCRIGECGGADVCFDNFECGDLASPPQVCTTDPLTMIEVCLDAEQLAAGFVEPSPPRPMTGLFNNLEVYNGDALIGLAFYDRTEGRVYAAQAAVDGTGITGTFTPSMVDGYGGASDNDCGISLDVTFVGSDWQLVYVDGIAEELLFMGCSASDTCQLTPTLIDDGFRLEPPLVGGNDAGPDLLPGIVGDDASLVAVDAANLRVAYHDASRLEAVMAVSSDSGANWTVTVLDATDGAGYWTSQTLSASDESYTATLYRNAGAAMTGTRVLVGTTLPVAP